MIDKKYHGIGLANIKSTVEKYQGTMDFKVKLDEAGKEQFDDMWKGVVHFKR